MKNQTFSFLRLAGVLLMGLVLPYLWGQLPAVWAECQYNLIPSLTVEEKYDDNIFLRPADETSDLISVISPAASFSAQCPTQGMTLSYQPGLVFYSRYSEYNTVRHNANLSAFVQTGAYTRIDLTDTFYRTEEPREPEESIYATRWTRDTYYRNIGDIRITRMFGPRDLLFLGYNDSHLENKDPLVEDSRIQTPYVGLAYWFDAKNGLDIEVRYSVSDYESSADFKQNSDSLRFTHLLSQNSSLAAAYVYTGMDYDPGRADYVVHDVKVLYSTNPAPHTTLSAGIGYFIRNPEDGGSSDGASYEASVVRRIKRGSISAGGQGGYRQELIDAENRGFAKFWSVNGAASYLILPYLTLSGGLNYLEEKFLEQADRRDTFWSATAGLAYSYRRWLSVALSGLHQERDSSVDGQDYDNNQIVLSILAVYN